MSKRGAHSYQERHHENPVSQATHLLYDHQAEWNLKQNIEAYSYQLQYILLLHTKGRGGQQATQEVVIK